MKKFIKIARGFTLIELLVVISIIGMLSSIILVGLDSARDKGRIAAGLEFATHNHRALGADVFAQYTTESDTANGTWIDSSGNNLNMTCGGGSTIVSDDSPLGKGNSRGFTGSSYCTANFSARPIYKDHTISVWIKPSSGFTILTNNEYESGLNLFAFGANGDNSLQLGTDISSSFNGFDGVVYTPLNKWSNVTFSVDSTNGIITSYLDGKLVSRGTFSVEITPDSSGNYYLTRLHIEGDGGQPFIMDDYVVYSGALTSAQVQQIYADGRDAHSLAQK